jgi:hypothetical protein
MKKGNTVTTLTQYRVRVQSAPAAAESMMKRFIRSANYAAAVLADSFAFAREMESAPTQKARQAVLDRYAPNTESPRSAA